MSGALSIGVGLGALGSVAFNLATQSFSFGMPRMIGGVIPDCAITESHSDRVIVTKHPVEKGAAISDHAYVDPPTVNIRWGWTEALRGEAWAAIMYQTLLGLMYERQPIDLFTGKRPYTNMVIESITENTDSWTEYALILDIQLVQVIIVSTESTSIPPDAQSQPQQTLPPQDGGHAAPVAVANQPSAPIESIGPNNLGPGSNGDPSLNVVN